MVTGGEDNAVKLFMYTNGTIQCLDSSEVHTSAVRALTVIPLTSDISMVFSGGGNRSSNFMFGS